MAANPFEIIRRLLPPDKRDKIDAIAAAMMAGAPPGAGRAAPAAWRQWLKQAIPLLIDEQIDALIAYASAAAKTARNGASVPLPPEPKPPPAKPTEQDMAKYQRDLGKYSRMMELLSKVIQNSHEMRKSIVRNMR